MGDGSEESLFETLVSEVTSSLHHRSGLGGNAPVSMCMAHLKHNNECRVPDNKWF